jgi:hypothetical protein
MTSRTTHAREVVASTAQYALLGGFASVAAGISAQGWPNASGSSCG